MDAQTLRNAYVLRSSGDIGVDRSMWLVTADVDSSMVSIHVGYIDEDGDFQAYAVTHYTFYELNRIMTYARVEGLT